MTQKTYNFLRPNGFMMTISDLPGVSFSCQSVTLPSISLSEANQPTPFIDIPRIGDKIQRSDFMASFIIDEDMSNYIELYNWMVGIGFPNSYEDVNIYLSTKTQNILKGNDTEPLLYSDITVTVLDSNNNPNITLTFRGCFPKLLSETRLDVKSESDIQYLISDVIFAYTFFDIKQ